MSIPNTLPLGYLYTLQIPMKKEKFQWSLLIVLLAILMACKHHPDVITDIIPPDDNGGVNPNDTVIDPCSDDTVYFANTVLPIILSHCSMPGCHNTPTNDNDNIVLTNYEQVMNYVVPGDLNSSELWDDAIAETDPDKIMPPPDATKEHKTTAVLNAIALLHLLTIFSLSSKTTAPAVTAAMTRKPDCFW